MKDERDIYSVKLGTLSYEVTGMAESLYFDRRSVRITSSSLLLIPSQSAFTHAVNMKTSEADKS